MGRRRVVGLAVAAWALCGCPAPAVSDAGDGGARDDAMARADAPRPDVATIDAPADTSLSAEGGRDADARADATTIDAPVDAAPDTDPRPDAPAADDATGDGCDAGAVRCSGVCVSDWEENPMHCGPTCTVCAGAPNATASCLFGACALFCAAGYGDCDSRDANGCEVRLDSVANCGTCGRACTAPANGTATCAAGGTCDFACDPGFMRAGAACVPR